MGKRNLNSTKSGRFMNPTDQSRKEARRKELKKNKKQRMAVRTAVLKSKDPLQLLEEAASYDRQEYDPNVASAFNERVLQEKRKKLLDTFDKLIHMYGKEDPDKYKELMKARTSYDKRRTDMMLYCEQVKLAQRVKANDIPLPDLPQTLAGSSGPLKQSNLVPKGIIKHQSSQSKSSVIKGRKPIGPPPGPPDDLSDSDSEEPDRSSHHIRFAEPSNLPSVGITGGFGNMMIPTPNLNQIPLHTPGFGIHGMPYMVEDKLQAQIQKPMINFTDPQALMAMPRNLPPGQSQLMPPSVNPGQQTIEAKPKLKNLIADATRLVPTALKVRRVVKDSRGRTETYGGVYHEGTTSQTSSISKFGLSAQKKTHKSQVSKDDAYDEFMREMENIL